MPLIVSTPIDKYIWSSTVFFTLLAESNPITRNLVVVSLHDILWIRPSMSGDPFPMRANDQVKEVVKSYMY